MKSTKKELLILIEFSKKEIAEWQKFLEELEKKLKELR